MNSSLFLENNISQFIIRYGKEDPDRTHVRPKQKPVSVSSEIELKTKKKIRRPDGREIPSVQKQVRKSVVQSFHASTQQRKEEKEYSRVPIEYMEEREGGNAADRVRGRVVYRGYAPKNTYFYFKTIKDLRVGSRVEKDYRGEDVVFNSKFESGNLNAAVRVNSREYWLYMREDTNTHGLRQWFYFEARARKTCRIRMRVYKFSKRFSLYREGMRPFVRTAECDWRQEGEKVRYDYDSDQKCFFLEFEYGFQEHKDTYFATLPPYTCTALNEYLETLAQQDKVSIRKIGTSLSGLDIHSVNISNRRHHRHHEREHAVSQIGDHEREREREREKSREERREERKEAIIVLARTHPGETVSNFALENFIARVLELEVLTDRYNFYIVPMVNPDGVFLGNHRTGVLGQDLNRNFHAIDIEFFPEIQAVETYIISIQKKMKVAFLFDLHGHSARRNIFAYGEEAESGSSRYLMGRIIPKLISQLVDSFKYDYCLFKATKEKRNTARVYFSSKNNINAVTFEQSYGLLDCGAIGISHWRNFGTALADSLVSFLQLPDLASISKYLAADMKEEQEQAQRKIEKKKQKERQKEREREEDLKMKMVFSKTEGNEEMSARSYSELFRKAKPKQSDDNLILIEQEKASTPSQSDSDLSSGDEDMQMRDVQLESIKKEIFRVGVINRESYKRELYNMAEKKVELSSYFIADYSHRLHHKHSSMVQRIFKFRSRQKTKEYDLLPQALSYREKGQSIELPVIKK